MSQAHYTADVALTSEGSALAILHEQILFFETVRDLDEYLHRLTKRRDAVVNKTIPLDDQPTNETEEGVGDAVEKFLIRVGNVKNALTEVQSSPDESQINPSEKANEAGIRNALLEFFKAGDWEVQEEVGGQTIRIPVKGKNGNWLAHAVPFEDIDQALFVSICSQKVPEDKRERIAEYITRANFGMRIGNFEMDYEDGEIRFKTSIDVEGSRLTYPLVRPLVIVNLQMMDHYLPGITRIIETDITPKEAIALIEMGTRWQ